MTNSPAYKDRTAWLIAIGLLELLVALGFLAMVALMSLVGPSASAFPGEIAGPNPMGSSSIGLSGGALVGASLMYLAMGACFAALGIGSMLCRRWARALSLIVAWLWLAGGTFGLVAMIAMGPWMRRMMAQAAAEAPNAASAPDIAGVFVGCMAVMIGLFGILVPAMMVLVYRSPDVIATCESTDPVARWTDQRPLPVLALSMLLASPVLSVLYLPVSGVTVLLGQVLQGPLAWLGTLIFAGLSVWCAWRVWALDIQGWWAGLILWLVMSVSYVALFSGDGQAKFLEASGAPQEQIDLMLEMDLGRMWLISALSFLALLIFFLYVKQFMGAVETPGKAGD